MNKIVYDVLRFNKSGEKAVAKGLSLVEADEEKERLRREKKEGVYYSVVPRVETV